MPVPKKFLHDRTILLLLSVNAFLTVLCGLLIVLNLEPEQGANYIVQYRSNLGFDEYKLGTSSGITGFILFSVFVLVFHTFLSKRVYHLRRHFSIAILGLGLLLHVLALIVSNELLNF